MWIALVIFGVINVVVCYSCCVVSSRLSRLEERWEAENEQRTKTV